MRRLFSHKRPGTPSRQDTLSKHHPGDISTGSQHSAVVVDDDLSTNGLRLASSDPNEANQDGPLTRDADVTLPVAQQSSDYTPSPPSVPARGVSRVGAEAPYATPIAPFTTATTTELGTTAPNGATGRNNHNSPPPLIAPLKNASHRVVQQMPAGAADGPEPVASIPTPASSDPPTPPVRPIPNEDASPAPLAEGVNDEYGNMIEGGRSKATNARSDDAVQNAVNQKQERAEEFEPPASYDSSSQRPNTQDNQANRTPEAKRMASLSPLPVDAQAIAAAYHEATEETPPVLSVPCDADSRNSTGHLNQDGQSKTNHGSDGAKLLVPRHATGQEETPESGSHRTNFPRQMESNKTSGLNSPNPPTNPEQPSILGHDLTAAPGNVFTSSSAPEHEVRDTTHNQPYSQKWRQAMVSRVLGRKVEKVTSFVRKGSIFRVKTEDLSPEDVIIAVMGPTGTGKSSFINMATGNSTGVGHELESCTSDINIFKFSCFERSSQDIIFVDTPGFDDTHKSDIEILHMIADWLKTTYERKVKLAGILYFHRISDNRMAGTPLKNLHMFEKLCGKDALGNIVLTTTMWDEVDEATGIQREKELIKNYWDAMITQGSRTLRYHNNEESAWEIADAIVQSHNDKYATELQRELVDLEQALPETGAGQELYGTLRTLVTRQQDTLQKLRAAMKRQDDAEIVLALKDEYESLRAQLEATVRDMEELKIPIGKRLHRFFSSRLGFFGLGKKTTTTTTRAY